MLNCNRILFLLIFSISALAVPRLTSQTIALEGTVKDSAGAAIAGASVHLSSPNYQADATSDANGHFLFTDVAGASGTIKASASGFNSAQQPWNAEATSHLSLEIVLRPASTRE